MLDMCLIGKRAIGMSHGEAHRYGRRVPGILLFGAEIAPGSDIGLTCSGVPCSWVAFFVSILECAKYAIHLNR